MRKNSWLKQAKENVAKLSFAFRNSNFLSAISFFGGIAAQEVIKYTGKFTPLQNIYINEFYGNIFKTQSFQEILNERADLINSQ
jgi:ubiquitin-activating enzyme E1